MSKNLNLPLEKRYVKMFVQVKRNGVTVYYSTPFKQFLIEPCIIPEITILAPPAYTFTIFQWSATYGLALEVRRVIQWSLLYGFALEVRRVTEWSIVYGISTPIRTSMSRSVMYGVKTPDRTLMSKQVSWSVS